MKLRYVVTNSFSEYFLKEGELYGGKNGEQVTLRLEEDNRTWLCDFLPMEIMEKELWDELCKKGKQ